MIVVNNATEHARKEREKQDNEMGDDLLLNPIITTDKSFVILSGMTTDEAIIIKKGIIKRIQKEYGNNFTTSETVIIKDSKVLAMEQQRDADVQARFNLFMNTYLFVPFLFIMGLLVLIVIWEMIKTKMGWY